MNLCPVSAIMIAMLINQKRFFLTDVKIKVNGYADKCSFLDVLS